MRKLEEIRNDIKKGKLMDKAVEFTPAHIKNCWVVEWSKNQNTFHIDKLENSLSMNWRAFQRGECEWLLLGILNTNEECHKFTEKLKKGKTEFVNTIEYPEHEKLMAVKDQNQAIGQFLEWLGQSKRLYLGHYTNDEVANCSTCKNLATKECPNLYNLDDFKEMEVLEADMECYEAQFVETNINKKKLLAEYFKIDLEKLEDEKRKIEIRDKNDAKTTGD